MVQPIYYSIDERICKERLTPLTPGMHEELSSWGPDCSDSIFNEVVDNIWADKITARNTEGFSGLIFILVCICTSLLVIVTFFAWKRWHNDRIMRLEAKRKEMRRAGENNQQEAPGRH